MYDVIVVGGGTSGMMAAISAATHGAKTLLIEKNKRLGKKLLLTGGGRCNVTNNRSPEEIIAHIPGNGKFLYSAFHQFDNYQIMAFFEERGVALKEEDHGRMFPVTDRSKTIVNCLEEELNKLHVTILKSANVSRLLTDENQNITGVELATKESYTAPCVIVSTGGMTYQYTGSTGDGYKLAKSVGHTITPLFPTEAPLVSKEDFIQAKTLQGLALQDVGITVWNEKQKKVSYQQMDLLFTHFGLSGPAALRSSLFVQRELATQKTVTVTIDALPEVSLNELLAQMKQKQQTAKERAVKNGLKNLLPERYLLFLLEKVQIDPSLPLKQLTPTELETFAKIIKQFSMQISGTWPLDKAFVTGGGVQLKEVNPKTLGSKLAQGLHFTGELLDINGYTGGYNITAAFVTGYVAGKHAAKAALSY